MLDLPYPPPPPQVQGTPAILACTLLILGGVLALMWGRAIHRILLAGVGLLAGVTWGGPLAGVLGWDALTTQIALASVLGLLLALTARLIWASLASSLLVLAVGVPIVAYHARHMPYPPPQPEQETTAEQRAAAAIREALRDASADAAGGRPADRGDLGKPPETLGAWLGAFAWRSGPVVREVFRRHYPVLLPATLGAMGVGLIAGLLRPKTAATILTPFLGGAAMVAGGVGLAVSHRADAWKAVAGQPIPAAIGVGVLGLGGMVFQFHQLHAAKKRTAAEEKDGEGDKKGESNSE